MQVRDRILSSTSDRRHVCFAVRKSCVIQIRVEICCRHYTGCICVGDLSHYTEEARKCCEGCEIDYPNQLHHECLMTDEEELWICHSPLHVTVSFCRKFLICGYLKVSPNVAKGCDKHPTFC